MQDVTRMSHSRLKKPTVKLQDVYNLGIKELQEATKARDWVKVHDLALKLARMDNSLQMCCKVLNLRTVH